MDIRSFFVYGDQRWRMVNEETKHGWFQTDQNLVVSWLSAVGQGLGVKFVVLAAGQKTGHRGQGDSWLDGCGQDSRTEHEIFT